MTTERARFHVCASLVPKPMTVFIGLGTRIGVRMPGSGVNSFYDHRKFEPMKSLNGWEAARCDEHPFRT